ncbi:hypothetical protein DYB25_006780 [Aphanomyces astaci]|uniref:Amino acid permease/ SLC12A domain-containing protein n=1 Tax=Aphanomyces astaci TaxID=112090 RepID=A0A397BST3_APHAT|nr:hypothetical protein DYB25_006780 [Aphanomyces astaci]
MQVVPSETLTKPAGKGRGRLAASSVDLWAIGITIVIGGQFFSWNAGLVVGTVGFGLAVGVVGVAYLCLACSMAEMSSMLPFAGGVYGLSRCTLGFYAGFILGCCEILEYLLYVVSVNVTLGRLVSAWWPLMQPYEPVVWFASHAFSLVILCVGGKVFWRFNLALAIALVGFVLMYCVGSASYANIWEHGGGSDWLFHGSSVFDFVRAFPMAMWFFTGIEALNTLPNEVTNPKTTIPKGQVAAMATLLVTATAIYVISLSLPPGVRQLPTVLSIFNGGFVQIFNLHDDAATLLSIPACYASTPGFLLASGNIVTALADSKLLPHVLHRRHPSLGTPVRALCCTTLASFCLCFFVFFHPGVDAVFYLLAMFFGCLAYTSQCVGYLFLKKRYPSMPRTFTSPFGVAGAVFAALTFTLCVLSIAFFQDDGHAAHVIMVAFVVALSIYYHGYAKTRQIMSEDERKVLFFVHVGTYDLMGFTTRLVIYMYINIYVVANHNGAKHKHRKQRGRLANLYKLLHRRMLQVGPPSTSKTTQHTTKRDVPTVSTQAPCTIDVKRY